MTEQQAERLRRRRRRAKILYCVAALWLAVIVDRDIGAVLNAGGHADESSTYLLPPSAVASLVRGILAKADSSSDKSSASDSGVSCGFSGGSPSGGFIASSVPEPTSLSLLAMGLLPLLSRRSRPSIQR